MSCEHMRPEENYDPIIDGQIELWDRQGLMTYNNDFDFVGNLILNDIQNAVRRFYRYEKGTWYLRRINRPLRFNPNLGDRGGRWEISITWRQGNREISEWKPLMAPSFNGRYIMPPRPGRGHDESWWHYCS